MRTANDELEPLDPRTAQNLYLKHKETECSPKTLRTHRYRTKYFMQWCDEKDIDNLNELSGRDLQNYRLWLDEEAELSKISLNQQLSTIRVFLKWAASIEAVPADLYEKLMVPRVKPEEERREETLDAENAQAILEYLEKYHYASLKHAVFALFWETGIRLGAANSLDVGDVDPENERIDLVHRPDQGTQLKNGEQGERPIAITPELATLLKDFVANNRRDLTDDFGRDPLITSRYGRMSRDSIRRLVYQVTAPCFRNEPCPDCTDDSDKKCPEAVSPHAIRRGSITHFLTEDVPEDVVGDRMNVSRDVLEKHYDKRSEEVKLEQRRRYLGNV